MIGINGGIQSVGTAVRGHNLIRRHTAEGGVRPTWCLAGLLLEETSFHHYALTCRRVVTIEYLSLYVGREKVRKRYCRKHEDYQHVGQIFLYSIHLFFHFDCKISKLL